MIWERLCRVFLPKLTRDGDQDCVIPQWNMTCILACALPQEHVGYYWCVCERTDGILVLSFRLTSDWSIVVTILQNACIKQSFTHHGDQSRHTFRRDWCPVTSVWHI